MKAPSAARPVSRYRVLIATTRGPVDVERLTREDPEILRSVACVGGTTRTAGIDRDYHAFVSRPTGLVERLWGHGRFRLDVSDSIDEGSSWQLGVLIAHALEANARLADKEAEADGIVWATGQVLVTDLKVDPINHLDQKLRLSLERLRAEARAGRRLLVVWPAANTPDVPPDVRSVLDSAGATTLQIEGLQPLWSALELPAEAAGSQRAKADERLDLLATVRQHVNRRRLMVAGAAGLATTAMAGVALWRLRPVPPEISVSVVPSRTDEQVSARAGAQDIMSVSYDYVRSDGVLHVRPRVPYLDLLRRGGPVEGIEIKGIPFGQTLPEVRFTVSNASPRNLVIVAVSADVIASEIRREAILVVESQTQGFLIVSNQGWGEVQDPVIRIAVLEQQRTGETPDILPVTIRMGSFERNARIRMREHVPPSLANASAVRVVGEIEHGPVGNRRTLRFSTVVRLAVYPGAPMGAGKPYNLSFPAGKVGKVIADLDPPEEIRPGQADTFRLRLRTDRSSTSRLRLDLLTIDRKVIEGPVIELEAFVPREFGPWQLDKIGRN